MTFTMPSPGIEVNQHGQIEFAPVLFEGHERARYAVGVVAIGGEVVPGLDNEFAGYALERARRYVDEGYVDKASLNPDGTELDDDDDRSVHFTVVENLVTGARTMGTMRLVIKASDSGNDTLLPVERLYPEAFPKPAVPGSVEDSRLTAAASGLTGMLFASGVNYVLQHQLGPVYGVVKPKFTQSLNEHGVPVTPIGDARYVQEINSTKQPIRVDLAGLTSNILIGDQAALFEEMRRSNGSGAFMFSGEVRA